MNSNVPPQIADTENSAAPNEHPISNTSRTVSTQPYSNHLSAQHGNIGCQLFTTSVTGATGSPIAQIPGRVIQAAISVRTFFQPTEKISKLEKTAHGIQALLALVLLGIAIKRYQDNEECHDTTTALCKNEILCQTIYSTVLLLGWGPSQIVNNSKKQTAATPPEDATSNISTRL